MECFAKRGWWCSAVSKARTDIENMLKVLRGKAGEDLALKALQVGQIVSQPSITDPTEGNLPTFETESLPFAQEFCSVIESRYGRFVSLFPYEPRIDPVRASIMVGVLLGCLPQLP